MSVARKLLFDPRRVTTETVPIMRGAILCLSAAAMLVSKRQMRIADVAFLCGFSDLSYFNRSFRKRFGETPRGYRK